MKMILKKMPLRCEREKARSAGKASMSGVRYGIKTERREEVVPPAASSDAMPGGDHFC